FGLPEEELREDVTEPGDAGSPREQAAAANLVSGILARLPANYAQLLELRFLRGYSTREIARELGSTVGGVRIMQLRALRAAAQVDLDD
ncbi:MAG: sigma-70 family RNA polymerase sigma factor, partial [Candidatus Dormibacteraeota bacterium]|nr:sigma-70 family RNA polymerase sigma factor [Candidatus Dormibacteraeota bacterium]